MRTLVLGGAGYIGGVVARHLLEAGHQVTVADNLSRGHAWAVPDGADFHLVDLLEEHLLADLMARDFDAVLHFAALSLVGESVTERSATSAPTSAGASTCSTPCGPPACAGWCSRRRRPSTASRRRSRSPNRRRPGPLLALDATVEPGHRIYNLGNGTGFSVREVVDTARLVTGCQIPTVESNRRAGDPPVLVASSARIRAEVGWVPAKPQLDDMGRRRLDVDAHRMSRTEGGRLTGNYLSWPRTFRPRRLATGSSTYGEPVQWTTQGPLPTASPRCRAFSSVTPPWPKRSPG